MTREVADTSTTAEFPLTDSTAAALMVPSVTAFDCSTTPMTSLARFLNSSWNSPVELAALLAVLAFGLFASYLPFIVSGRYRIPVIPFLLFFGAYAVHQIIEFVRERQWRLLAGWGLTAAGLVVLTHVNWAGFEPDETGFLYGRGRSYDLDGQTAVAARFFQQAAEREPRYSRKLTLAARSYMARGRAEAALVRLRHAVAGNPRDPEAWLLLAEILDGQGRADEARRALQDGMKQNSASASLRRALASHETNP